MVQLEGDGDSQPDYEKRLPNSPHHDACNDIDSLQLFLYTLSYESMNILLVWTSFIDIIL